MGQGIDVAELEPQPHKGPSETFSLTGCIVFPGTSTSQGLSETMPNSRAIAILSPGWNKVFLSTPNRSPNPQESMNQLTSPLIGRWVDNCSRHSLGCCPCSTAIPSIDCHVWVDSFHSPISCRVSASITASQSSTI